MYFFDRGSYAAHQIAGSGTQIGELCRSKININNGLCIIDFGANYIAADDFQGKNEELIDLIMPSAIIRIDEYALGKTNILRLEIPSDLTEIPNGCCIRCPELRQVVCKPYRKYQTTSVGAYAFAGDEKLTTVTLPKGIKFIKEGCFSGCNALTSLAIPATVESIGKSAFKCKDHNVKLKHLVITNCYMEDPGSGMNITQEEYRQAQRANARKRICELLKDTGADLSKCSILTTDEDYSFYAPQPTIDDTFMQRYTEIEKTIKDIYQIDEKISEEIGKQLDEQIKTGNRYEVARFIMHKNNDKKVWPYIDFLLATKFKEAESKRREEEFKKIDDFIPIALQLKALNDQKKAVDNLSIAKLLTADHAAKDYWANTSYIEDCFIKKQVKGWLEQSYQGMIKKDTPDGKTPSGGDFALVMRTLYTMYRDRDVDREVLSNFKYEKVKVWLEQDYQNMLKEIKQEPSKDDFARMMRDLYTKYRDFDVDREILHFEYEKRLEIYGKEDVDLWLQERKEENVKVWLEQKYQELIKRSTPAGSAPSKEAFALMMRNLYTGYRDADVKREILNFEYEKRLEIYGKEDADLWLQERSKGNVK